MTKKDYVLLAEYIRRIKDDSAREEAAVAVADACKSQNGAFRQGTFFSACKVEL